MFGIMETTGKCYENVVTTLDDFTKRMKCSNSAVPKDYINWWTSGHKCEHGGCFKDGSVECHAPAEQDIELIEHLCQDHAYEAGYCCLCGSFWGGIESFDFNNPSHLCEHCLEQVKYEIGEDDDVNGENEDGYYP